MERVVNVDKFQGIGITQMFEALGKERMLDLYAENTQQIYLTMVTEGLASLNFENQSSHPSTWKLTCETSYGSMVMNMLQAYSENFLSLTLPFHDRGVCEQKHLSLEGKILQNISLENMLIRLGDRGKVRTWDCRVIHSLLYGVPKLLWRHIMMMNIWDTRESYFRKMIPYVQLINTMIVLQNRLPGESLWVKKPLEDFELVK
ncbi:hypothetical protein Hanom_Chr12g01145991 [Helianthus anomalus]